MELEKEFLRLVEDAEESKGNPLKSLSVSVSSLKIRLTNQNSYFFHEETTKWMVTF